MKGMIKMNADLNHNPELDLMRKALLDVADTFQKAYNIAGFHVQKNKPMMTKDVFIETYFPGPDFALLTVEYGMTREEIHDVYKNAYRKLNSKRIAELND